MYRHPRRLAVPHGIKIPSVSYYGLANFNNSRTSKPIVLEEKDAEYEDRTCRKLLSKALKGHVDCVVYGKMRYYVVRDILIYFGYAYSLFEVKVSSRYIKENVHDYLRVSFPWDVPRITLFNHDRNKYITWNMLQFWIRSHNFMRNNTSTNIKYDLIDALSEMDEPIDTIVKYKNIETNIVPLQDRIPKKIVHRIATVSKPDKNGVMKVGSHLLNSSVTPSKYLKLILEKKIVIPETIKIM